MRHLLSSIVLWILLLVAVRNHAAAWNFEVVDSGNGVGPYASIKVAPTGQIHISYFAGSQGYLKYARFDQNQWTTQILDANYLTGHHTSIDLDSAGRPHIAYRYYTPRTIRYASQDESGWTFSDFETDPDIETDITMALDDFDHPHVGYYDGEFQGEPHDVKYGHHDGASWSTSLVDAPGQVGRGCALALDSAGHPHMSYFDETNVTLKYAHFDGQWTVTTLDNVEFIAFNFRTAIGVDSVDRVHIVYSTYHYDGAEWFGRLKYATYDGAAWTTSVIEQAAPNRDYRIPAIAIDASNRPHATYLIYYNAEPITADLKYARYDGAGWRIEFIDTGDIADSDFSNDLDLDSGGRPHVSYARSGTLIHAVGASPVGVEDAPPTSIADRLVLLPPYPNPSAGTATLDFSVPRDGEIELGLYETGGRRVRTVARGWYSAGAHSVLIEPALPSGVYFGRLIADGCSAAQRLIVR